MKTPTATDTIDIPTHQYLRHRKEVMALLRSRFGAALNDADREDLYHEAWAGVVESRRKGRPLADQGGLLKTIAWRRARDRIRNRSAEPSDPIEGAVALALDRSPAPEEQVEQRLQADVCRRVIESLSERQCTVLKLRCELELTPAEIQSVTGLGQKAYEKHLTKGLKAFAAAFGEYESGGMRERHRELLLACQAGTATDAEREMARRLVESDPSVKAMLREIRGAAALLPLPLVLWPHGSPLAGLVARVIGWKTSIHSLGCRGHAIAASGGSSAGRALPSLGASKIAALCACGFVAAGGLVGGLVGHHEQDVRTQTPPVARVMAADVQNAARSKGLRASAGESRPTRSRRAPAAPRRRQRHLAVAVVPPAGGGDTSRGFAPPPSTPANVPAAAGSPVTVPARPRPAAAIAPAYAAAGGTGEFGP